MRYVSLLVGILVFYGNLIAQDAADTAYTRAHNLNFEVGVFTGWEEASEGGGAVSVTEVEDPAWGKSAKIDITTAQTTGWKYGTGIRIMADNLLTLDSLVNSPEEVTEMKYAISMWMKKDPSTEYKQVQLRCVFKPNTFSQQVPGPVSLTDDWEKYIFETIFYKQYISIQPSNSPLYDPAGDSLKSIQLTIAGGHETGIYYVDNVSIEPYDSARHYRPPNEPLNNFDFELGIHVGWAVAADGGVVSLAQRTSPERGKYLEVYVADNGSSQWPYTQGCSFTDVVPVEKGEVYQVSLLMKSPTPGKSFQLRLPYETELTGSGWWGQQLSPQVSLTEEWKEYSWYLQMPETVTNNSEVSGSLAGLSMLLGCGGDTGVVHIDDIRFTKIESGTVDQVKSVYYVSGTNGSDTNPGTKESPFKTIQKALDLLDGNDSLVIREGTYHEELNMAVIQGDSTHPVVITAYPGETVVLDGRVDIEQSWELHEGNIYKTTLSHNIWQLFVDEEMMTSARWPDVQVFSKDTWSWERKGWRRINSALSDYGTVVDDAGWDGGNTLAGRAADYTGAIAILNAYYWNTYVRKVENHGAGQDSFNYRADFLKDSADYGKFDNLYGSWYYLEGHLEMLDTPGEWFFDPATKELYVWTQSGSSPAGNSIKGKVQSYALTGTYSSHVTLKNIDFMATTLKYELCTHMTIEDCHFLYPSYSKRMLGDIGGIEMMALDNSDAGNPSWNTIRNCEFSYSDGSVLYVRGKYNLIENCLFHDLDYSGAPGMVWAEGIVTTNHTENTIFRMNTIYNTGGSETVGVGRKGLYELNDIYNGGMLQGDGTCFQTGPKGFKATHFRYNWTHDTYKRGIRLDDGGGFGESGYDSWIYRNVAWNCGYQGIQAKGDSNHVYNNLSFDNRDVDINLVYAPDKNALNTNTFTFNNLSGNISKKQSDPDNIILGTYGKNWIGFREELDIRTQVRDIENRDFRLRADSRLTDGGSAKFGRALIDDFIWGDPDVGAYESGDSVYHIPGRRTSQASAPVPEDGGTSHYEFVDLIWKQGYMAVSYDIYFGTDSGAVASADHLSAEFKGNQSSNIFPPGELVYGTRYFWRIDAVGEHNQTEGKVWSFTAGVNANPEVHAVEFQIYGYKDEMVFPLDSVKIWISGRQTRTGEDGTAKISMLKPGKYLLDMDRKGYEGKTDSITIDSSFRITDTLAYETYMLNIQLKDKDTGEPVAGGEIMFEDLLLLTDSFGIALVTDIGYGWYSLSAEAVSYLPIEPIAVEIFSDTTIVLSIEKDYLEALVTVVDRVSGDPIYRATITYGDQLKSTNSSGEATCDKLQAGTWVFSLEHNDFFLVIDSVQITGDIVLTIDLTPKLASVRFNISDSGGQLAGKLVDMNGLQISSDADGVALFYNQPARQDYSYSIEEPGYHPVFDTLWLEIDTVVNIFLSPITSNGNLDDAQFRIWPNPVRDKLHLQTDASFAEIRIVGIDGRMLMIREIYGRTTTLDVSSLPAGICFLYFKTINGTGKVKLMIIP